MSKLINVRINTSILTRAMSLLNKQWKKKAGVEKKTFARNTLKAMNSLMPVWMGTTWRSITVSETGVTNYQTSPTYHRGMPPHTLRLPLGAGKEEHANHAAVLAKSNTINMDNFKPVIITVASSAVDAGLFEGRVPLPKLTRTPRNCGALIVAAANKGTAFKKGR